MHAGWAPKYLSTPSLGERDAWLVYNIWHLHGLSFSSHSHFGFYCLRESSFRVLQKNIGVATALLGAAYCLTLHSPHAV